MATLDIRAMIQAIPYVTPPAPPSRAVEAAAAADAALAEAAIKKATENLNEKSGKWASFSLADIVPAAPIMILGKTIGALQKVTDFLTPILKLLQLFIGAFASFSAILSALIDFVQMAVNEWAKDMMGAGVFLNVIVPPGLMKNFQGSVASGFMSTGGFNGFINRIGVSLRNTADPNRPVFSENAEVGGFIILVDSESPASFFGSMKQLGNLFDFMNLLPINTEPPPPTNIQGLYGIYKSHENKNGKLGIEVKWDAPPLRVSPMSYRISRSQIQNGVAVVTNPAPTKLGGPDGFIHAVRVRLASFFSKPRPNTAVDPNATKRGEWPPVYVQEYKDPEFNGGKPKVVKANPVTGGGSFIDYDMPARKTYQLYYVVEAGFGTAEDGIWGPRTPELQVPMPSDCIPPEMAAVIQHERGALEFVSVGLGALGSWSSISLKMVIPFMPMLLEMFNKLLNILKGMLSTGSSAFADFINALIEKIEYYAEIVEILNAIVTQIKRISLDQSVAFLYVPADDGGVSGFMTRLKAAKQPSGGFTGPNGMTAGIVFMFGASATSPIGESDENAIESQAKALQTSFSLIMNLLAGD